jgi:uncharacterized protein (DUF2147 family)
MKKILLLCLTLCIVAGVAFAADSVEGYWLSVDEKTGKATAGWHIYTENGLLYGRILSVAGKPQDEKAKPCTKGPYKGFPDMPADGKAQNLPAVGPRWIYGLKMDKPGVWSGGSIIDLESSGNLYHCKITFRPADNKKYKVDTLEMRGELFWGIGRSQFWQKSNKTEASSLR